MAQPFSKIPIQVWQDKRLTLEQLRVLGVLFSFADKGLESWPSRAAIAERCGMHVANVSSATSKLVEYGWLSKEGKGGHSMPARYTITIPETIADSATVNPSRFDYRSSSKTLADSATTPLADSATTPLADSATTPLADSATRKEQTIEPTNELTIELVAGTPAPAVADAPRKTKLTEAQKETCRKTWDAYAEAYSQRYGTDPVRNQRVNAQVIAFCKRIPHTESPLVARHYVESNSAFYVSRGHQFGNLLADAEKLRTEWATGRSITQATARQIDATQSNFNAVEQAIAMAAGRKS